MKPGDRFFLYPHTANWQIHHNTCTDCEEAFALDLLDCQGVHVKDNAIAPA